MNQFSRPLSRKQPSALHQPLVIRFEFRKFRSQRDFISGTSDARHQHDGTIYVVFTVSNIRYGPYTTGITTFRSIWDG
jgi:hypothetical protein